MFSLKSKRPRYSPRPVADRAFPVQHSNYGPCLRKIQALIAPILKEAVKTGPAEQASIFEADVHGYTSVAGGRKPGATDDHRDRIVDAVREVFDEGNAFCKKITYKIGKREAEESIKAFRTDPQFRISRDAQGCANVAGGRKPRATTVDMIATGTDIRPLECVMFMRDVTRTQFRKSLTKPEGVLKGKSQAYYEQMKGRGTRVISRDELRPNFVRNKFGRISAPRRGERQGWRETKSQQYFNWFFLQKLLCVSMLMN